MSGSYPRLVTEGVVPDLLSDVSAGAALDPSNRRKDRRREAEDKSRRARRDEAYEDNDLVFAREDGSPLVRAEGRGIRTHGDVAASAVFKPWLAVGQWLGRPL
jgi:hypothetical protein